MGKRELLIIVAFLVVGAVAYQLAAPAAPEDRGFSLSRFLDSVRREVRGNPGAADWESTGTIAVSAELTELRIGSATRGVEVIGEARDDIEYVLSVSSNGPDNDLALQYAKAVVLERDDLGFALGLRIAYPDEARQTSGLVLRVPRRLTVRAEGRSIQASGVAGVDLENVVGDTTLRDIAGRVSGAHRSGRLVVEGAQEANLSLTNSESELSAVRGDIRVTARNGELVVRDAAGPLEIDQVNLDLSLQAPRGTVYVSGTGGEIRIVDPQGEVRVDTRRAEVELQLDRGVTATVLTSGDTIRLLLGDATAISLDAVATNGGEIQAAEFELAAEGDDRERRLRHTFNGGTTRVALRNDDGEIVIRRRQ